MNILNKKHRARLIGLICTGIISFTAASQAAQTYTLDNIRDYIVGIDEAVELEDGTSTAVINFDNAATTPALQPVVDEVNEKLKMYGAIGRSVSQKSYYSTDVYSDTRSKVLSFVNADSDRYTCFYVNNTTDGLNKLASALVTDQSEVVLTTRMEHHSNDLPWRGRCHVIYAEVDELGRVRYDELEEMLKTNKVSYVSVTAASNVTGYVTDVHRVAALAHKYGAMIIVDGAEIVAHRAFSMTGETPEEDIDFFVFSAHKMDSPFGGGAVVGRTDVLQEIGFDKIQAHEQALNRKLIDGLLDLGLTVYGDTRDISDRVGVVTFNDEHTNSALLAAKLSRIGAVATRRGAFCAHPYVWRLLGVSDDEVMNFEGCAEPKTPGMIRVSFGIYNTEEEVERFLELLPKAIEEVRQDLEREPLDAPESY